MRLASTGVTITVRATDAISRMRGMSDMVWPNYFKILTALTLTAAAAVLAALLIAAAPASAQEGLSVVGTDPSDQQTGVLRDTNVQADFWSPVDQTTVNTDTFTLAKQGTTTPVAAWVTYNAYCLEDTGFPCGAVLNPNVDLDANTTYTATLKGGENGVKDYSGTPAMAADYSWSFTTGDSSGPPETTITSAPCLKQVGNDIYMWSPCETTTTSASFAFTSPKLIQPSNAA
jgi:hypothetical protein